MKYAIIENDIIANTIESEEKFAISIGAISLPDGFGIGDTYIKGEFIKKETPMPIEVPKLGFNNLTQEEKDNLLYTLAKSAGIVE